MDCHGRDGEDTQEIKDCQQRLNKSTIIDSFVNDVDIPLVNKDWHVKDDERQVGNAKIQNKQIIYGPFAPLARNDSDHQTIAH